MTRPDPLAEPSRIWSYVRGLVVPLLIWGVIVLLLARPVEVWLMGQDSYDRDALKEWLDELRGFRETLPEMVEHYLSLQSELERIRKQSIPDDHEIEYQLKPEREEIREHLRSLGGPLTKLYGNQVPLFPTIYTIQVRFDPAVPGLASRHAFLGVRDSAVRDGVSINDVTPDFWAAQTGLRDGDTILKIDGSPVAPADLSTNLRDKKPGDDVTILIRRDGAEQELKAKLEDASITWDSEWPVRVNQYKEMTHRIGPHAEVYIRYQMHAFSKRQREEQVTARRLWLLMAFAAPATILGLSWLVLVQRRARQRERQRLRAEYQAAQNERLLLKEQNRNEETERALLEQRLATQVAEQRALEMKSQLFANIGIMAGSYAHNIKNLLVRPNDLLMRCLEADSLSSGQATMLQEVRETLGTVTERLQQILRTVRRDPTQTQPTRLDLNVVLRDLEHTWRDLGRDRWKLEIVLDLAGEECAIDGDLSHLQQAIENLLFNARDATFEQRVGLRDAAHRTDEASRKQALIAAAAWRGRVVLRTRRTEKDVILEVSDNGAGMTEEVRNRCTEPHFSTKRDNALFEGLSTGMGLGLSFVVAVLEHHHSVLEIDSTPGEGTTFRVRFAAV